MAAKRELETRVEDLEDEQDEANLWAESLQQCKARLKLANQMVRQQHQKEVEACEGIEQTKTTMNNKVRVRCGWMGSYGGSAHYMQCSCMNVHGIYSNTCTCIAWNVHCTCSFGRLRCCNHK